MNNLLTLKQAGKIISANNDLPIATSTLQSWAKSGALPTSRLGRMYVVSRDTAESFVVADHVRPKGNPNWIAGTPRPKWTKCDQFTAETGRCKKKARWVLTVALTDRYHIFIKRCDRHKDELLARAEDNGFKANVLKVEPMPRQERNDVDLPTGA